MASQHLQHLAHLAHLAHAAHSGRGRRESPAWAGSYDINDAQKQSTPTDYKIGQFNWTQTTPGTNADASEITKLAPSLTPNMAGKDKPFKWNVNAQDPLTQARIGNYNQFFQGPNSLQNGPGNAYSPTDMANMHAMALGQLNAANQQAMRGLAASNAGRGVVGNNAGGIMQQQLGVSQAGALAQGDLAERQAGLTLGNQQYNARANAAQNTGAFIADQNRINAQQQQDTFQGIQQEKQNAFSKLQTAMQAYSQLQQLYGASSSVTSGQGKGMGDQEKMYIRAHLDDAKREYLLALKNYQAYA